jgi:hypothetical protein
MVEETVDFPISLQTAKDNSAVPTISQKQQGQFGFYAIF